jgi:hypothetical protein
MKVKRISGLAGIAILGLIAVMLALVLANYGSGQSSQRLTVPSAFEPQSSASAQQTSLPTERQTAVAVYHAKQTVTAQAADPSIQATLVAVGRLAQRNMLIEQLQGTVIAQSQSTPNVTSSSAVLVGYRVEELTLSQPLEFGADGKKVTTDKVWRLVVIGSQPFPIMTRLHTIYMDSTLIGSVTSDGSNELRVTVPDRSVLVEGGTISLLGPNSPNGAKVPDKLHFTTSGQQPSVQQTSDPTARETLVAEFHANQTVVAQDGGPSARATSDALAQRARIWGELARLTGPVIAQSQNTPDVPPTGPGLIGYRVEELTLAQPVEFESNGKKITTDKVWRLTVISAQPLPLLSEPYTIYVDDTVIGYASQPDHYKLRVYVPDRALLPEGGTISVSRSKSLYGAKVPEKLHFVTR